MIEEKDPMVLVSSGDDYGVTWQISEYSDQTVGHF